MSIIIALSAALLPAILLWLYIWKKDPQPEPTSWLVKAVVWGMAICVPVAFLEMLIQTMFWGVDGEPTTLIGSTMQAFIVAALPEESFKLLGYGWYYAKIPISTSILMESYMPCALVLDLQLLKTYSMCLVKRNGCQ